MNPVIVPSRPIRIRLSVFIHQMSFHTLHIDRMHLARDQLCKGAGSSAGNRVVREERRTVGRLLDEFNQGCGLDDQFTVDAQGRNQSLRIDVADVVLLRDGTICADTDVFVVEPFIILSAVRTRCPAEFLQRV